MKVLGLTGGIGSGKTTVAGFFSELGVPVFIADNEGKRLMEEDPVLRQKITKIFGEIAYKDGSLDREYIASKVFVDKELLEQLNAVVHPAVAHYFEIWKSRQNSPYVVYEAAILFEKGGYKNCDYTLLITAPKSVRIDRILNREISSREKIEARMDNQWSDEKKSALADFIIKNDNLSKTRKAVRNLHQNLLESA